jgi:hypothetical protein
MCALRDASDRVCRAFPQRCVRVTRCCSRRHIGRLHRCYQCDEMVGPAAAAAAVADDARQVDTMPEPRGCESSSCSRSHSSDGSCLVCGRTWGSHSGHTCVGDEPKATTTTTTTTITTTTTTTTATTTITSPPAATTTATTTTRCPFFPSTYRCRPYRPTVKHDALLHVSVARIPRMLSAAP